MGEIAQQPRQPGNRLARSGAQHATDEPPDRGETWRIKCTNTITTE